MWTLCRRTLDPRGANRETTSAVEGAVGATREADGQKRPGSRSGRAACLVLLEGPPVTGRGDAHLSPEVEPQGRTRAETAILRDALHRVVRGLQPALGGQYPLL